MTKKFFNDWQNKRSLTSKIELNEGIYFEEKNRWYQVYDHCIFPETVNFENEFVSVKAKVHWFSLNSNKYGSEIITVKIHRIQIKTIKFKQV